MGGERCDSWKAYTDSILSRASPMIAWRALRAEKVIGEVEEEEEEGPSEPRVPV